MNLEQAILEGRRTLADHPDRDLPLRNRILIWTALGPRKIIDDRYAADGVGLRARFALAKSCVLKVLPIWEEAFNSAELAPIWKIESMHGDMPRQLLEIADHVMSDRSKLVYGSEFYGKGWLFSDNVGAVLYDNRFPRPCVNAVCSAACRCLSVAMNDEYYNENDPDDLDSLIGDPYTVDPACYACAAFANGWDFQPESEASRRAEFWEWYLSEAAAIGMANSSN